MSECSPAPAAAPTGLLLANTGTPEAPTARAVRRYLAEFLADPRVIRLPRRLWLPILHGIILNTRPARSARLYRRIWTDAGGPLGVESAKLTAAVGAHLGGGWRVELGMCYGWPSIREALEALQTAGCGCVVVLPLFPQYCTVTTEAVMDRVDAALGVMDWRPRLRAIQQYFDDAGYRAALVARIRAHWLRHGEPDRLLMSFHGIPLSYVGPDNPYAEQCAATAGALARELGRREPYWAMAYQSKFGPGRWLEPATYEVLREWGAARVGRVHVVCPGFATDGLETLEEIALGGEEVFGRAGGGSYAYIPALNDAPEHVAALAALARGAAENTR